VAQYRSAVDVEFYGYVEEGDENYHEVVLYEGETFDIELEGEEEDVDLDLYVTDEEDNVLYKDEDPESEADAWFKPKEDAVYRFWVKGVNGETEYILHIEERE
jgi:hypothetical protein